MKRLSVFASCVAVIMVASSWSAQASKENFKRNKPHVNVGMIGAVGFGQSAIASIRLAVPSVNEDGEPSCGFDGIAILSTNLRSVSGSDFAATVQRFDEVFTVDVDLSDPRDVVLIPLDLQAPQGAFLHFLFEVRANNTVSMDQCGLDVGVDVMDLATGGVVTRHKPFFTKYRPQFYLRTTGVTGEAATLE